MIPAPHDWDGPGEPPQRGTGIGGAVLAVRSRENLAALMPAVRRTVAELDPRVAVAQVETMDEVVASSLAQPLRLRFFLSLFAALALLLGTVGVYGVVSYAVARRRAEFGIRIALGASPARVLGDVVRRGLTPVAVGIAAGLVGALLLARALSGFLYGVEPSDPASLVAAGAALMIAGAAAAVVPGIRASQTNPVEAIRAE